MKHFLLILIAVAVMMQSFTKMLIIVNFNLHQQTIAKTLCEKRNVKGSCCAGRCQLKKRLNEEDKNEKAPNPTNSKEKLEELFCEKKSDFKIDLNKNFELQFPIASNSVLLLYSKGIFHPPCC